MNISSSKLLSRTINFYILLILMAVINTSCGNGPFPIGKNATLLADLGEESADFIEWSPSGNQLAITTVSFEKDFAKISIFDIDRNHLQLVVETSEHEGMIHGEAWSPDETRFLFSTTGSIDFEKGIWVVDVNSTALPIFLAIGSHAAWSSTGELATTRVQLSQGILFFYISDPETNEILHVLRQPGTYTTGFDWSPEGTKLVASWHRQNEQSGDDIYVLDINTGESIQITTDGNNIHPKWSPRRELIAYIKQDSTQFLQPFRLYIMKPDGSCAVEVPELGIVWSPTWSPDGTQIAFINNGDIYLVDLVNVFGEIFLSYNFPCNLTE